MDYNSTIYRIVGISIVDFWIGILLGYQLVNKWRIIGQTIYQLVQDFATIHRITSLMVLMSKWVKLRGMIPQARGIDPKDLEWLGLVENGHHVETRNSQTTRGQGGCQFQESDRLIAFGDL